MSVVSTREPALGIRFGDDLRGEKARSITGRRLSRASYHSRLRLSLRRPGTYRSLRAGDGLCVRLRFDDCIGEGDRGRVILSARGRSFCAEACVKVGCRLVEIEDLPGGEYLESLDMSRCLCGI